MNTFQQCKNSSRIQRISGLCSTSDEFRGLFNDAVNLLVNRGDFYGTVRKIRACVYGNLIVWPRQVATVLAINRCNSTVPLHNHWFEFNRVDRSDILGYWGAGYCGQINGVQGDTSPVFNPINCADGVAGVYLRFYPTQPSDIGRIITVFGIDSNGEELRSTHADGIVQDGIEVTLALPFATMPASDRNVNTMRHVTRLVKDITDGPVYAYQYRASDDTLLNLGRYEASETLPDYQTTRLGGSWPCVCPGVPQTISALVKVQHIDVVNPNDLVVIENMEAIALAMQAIKNSDAYDMRQKREAEAEAIHALNLELRTRLPLDEIPIKLSAFGTALPSRHMIGRMR
jgi:hypothetical protein